MRNTTHTLWMVLAAIALASPVLAANGPTAEQVYAAARSGHLQEAERMIDQVLRDHPKSAKAHYIAAEVYAREGRLSIAREQLGTAQSLAPGLPFARPEAVAALQKELANRPVGELRTAQDPRSQSVPWGMLILLIGGVVLLVLYFHRRNQLSTMYPQPNAAGAGIGMPATPASNATAGIGAGGIGSGIVGGVASGLAVGAGVVAGEELARRFLHPRDHDAGATSPDTHIDGPQNVDMGGDDFGLHNDDSWDDPAESSSDFFSDDDWG